MVCKLVCEMGRAAACRIASEIALCLTHNPNEYAALSGTVRLLMSRIIFALGCLLCALYPVSASAWAYQGHRVIGSIAGSLLKPNASLQVRQILNPPGSHDPSPRSQGFNLRKAGPWADCVKSVAKLSDGTFKYALNELHPDYELPRIPFKHERHLME